MWLFCTLLVLFHLSLIQRPTLITWSVFFEKDWASLAHDISHFWPHSDTVYFSWTDSHWLITVLSGYLLMVVQPQKQKGKVAKSISCMWPPTSLTQEKSLQPEELMTGFSLHAYPLKLSCGFERKQAQYAMCFLFVGGINAEALLAC